MDIGKIREILGEQGSLLDHKAKVPASMLTLPSPRYVDDVFTNTDRTPRVLGGLQRMLSHGRLADTGFLSIFPVDQGIEHAAGASFAPNPMLFDPENIIKLAIEGGCNAVASTFGVLGATARKYAHKIPYIVKINHNELLSYPNTYDQTMFGNVKQALDMGAAGIGATVYWGCARDRAASCKRCPPRSRRRTSSACSPCCGATSATMTSRPRPPIRCCRPISPARPTTSA